MIIANFSNGEKTELIQTGLWQYDYGQILRIQGLDLPTAVEIHFSTQKTGGEAITRIGTTRDGVTDVVIPDIMLEKETAQDYYVYAFIYLTDGTSGQTEYRIQMSVKSRPKPEAFDRPEDAELFREAIAAVNESAGRAENAEKSSEAWAHGREDYPEREQDNAKYYAGLAAENAQQTSDDLAETQRIAESIAIAEGSISADKEAVAELKEQTQAAAQKALLSERNAKESEESAAVSSAAAEAAEAQAELFAGRTEEDKNTVEQAKAVVMELERQVAEDKTYVESTVDEFELIHQQAVADVNNAGQTQIENIGTETEQVIAKVQEEGNQQAVAVQQAAQTQINAIKEAGGGVENALSNYFALRRNGKVFTTKIYKYATSTSPVGVKMNANETMVCEPSVGRTEGRDDYAQYGLFQHFTCNFSVDENGFNHVDALEGQTGFTKYGKVQVGEVTMSAWFGIEDTADAVLYHYSDSQTELTPHPMKESINPDGTLSPFMIHAKYAAGDIEGAPYSSKGLAPANGCQAAEAKNPVSYTGMITYMHKLGGHYCGTTSWDLFYRQLMMIIKYATTHSQSIMAGCTSYSYQYMNLVEETGVSRVIVTTDQAANYVVGSYVSIGEIGESTNKDRHQAYMHNMAYSVKILSIENVDDVNAAIYVDAPAFDTTLTTCISTMPWRSGSTDEVAGSDGSLGSNTSGKYAFKIQGIETGVGAYEVLSNVVMDIVTGADGNPARDVYVCQDASALSSNIATVRANYRKANAQVAYTAESWKYITEETTDPDLGIMIPTGVGGGSTTGFADGLYTDAGTSGQREWLALGHLRNGGYAGLWFLAASLGWSVAGWYIVSGVSPNGTRGEWQAAA